MLEHDLTGSLSLGSYYKTPAAVHPLALGTRHGVFFLDTNGVRFGFALFAELIHPEMLKGYIYEEFGNWYAGAAINLGYLWK